MTWRTWFLGIISAGISGMTTCAAVYATDHNRFNFDNWAGIKASLSVTGIAAGVSIMKYLAQYKIPGAPPNP